MTILITGASGRTSGFVIEALLDGKAAVPPSDLRLLVRSEAAIEKIRARFPQLPPSSFAIGDYLEASTLPTAVKMVDIVFHNAPAFHPQETAMGIALIDAAKQAGVKHFVYCSVLFSILTKLLNHKVKRDVEEYLIESGLNYTILQPSSFMQNINLSNVLESGRIMCAYSPGTLQGYLDLRDLAAVARLVILDTAPHNRARYDLVGQNCTYEDVALELSSYLGKTIPCEQVPRDQAVKKALGHVKIHGDDYAAEALDRMLYYYDKRGIPGTSNITRWLLGREPTSWAALIRRDLQGQRV
ncbi:NAD-P-binding protein [Obba rivulosa]|uniref:NAD-P-binding protein n=1 Tax=Obba rivulosa TaxID=1052685 RepID=A0A8E2J3N6_9APHY|nr:NAD-P-binding protein [Obba rivulosa]